MMNANPLSPQILLKDLFTRFPETQTVFFRHRMDCVGCCMSIFDTLEDAAVNYGLPEAAFMAELQAIIDPCDQSPGKSNHQ